MNKFFCTLFFLFLLASFDSIAQNSFNTVPIERKLVWNTHSTFGDAVLKNWANREIPFKSLSGKNNAIRILLAKLKLHQDIEIVNTAIMQLTAWGVSGTSWKGNKKGDYDFTIFQLTTILYLFGDQPDVLYPKTKDYLLNVLLTEQGNKFRYTAPNTLGLIPETENHLLMTEGSKYLKNRWINLHGNADPYYNNETNGLENELLQLLTKLKTKGLYEFNSIPYAGYTISALLNLEAFGSDKIKNEARAVLDYINWTFALGSFQLKHYPPMRRRYEKVGIQNIKTDYHAIFINTWMSYAPIPNFISNVDNNEAHAVFAACLPYRVADQVVEMLINKGDGYFVQLGHGKKSTPEIYAAGKHFLISAGGANRGYYSQIVTRPITVFLEDSAKNLNDCFHLEGPGNDFMKWNNTGVYKNFACVAGPVHVPKAYNPLAKEQDWAVYQAKNNVNVVVFSTPACGLIFIDENAEPLALLKKLMSLNANKDLLSHQFTYPNEQVVKYDLNAPPQKWVITTFNNVLLERAVDKWPLINSN